MPDFDLIVIGSGPAGRPAAIQAAKLKRSVLVVEWDRKMGGVSLHTGEARFTSPHEIELTSDDGKRTRYTGEKFVISSTPQ